MPGHKRGTQRKKGEGGETADLEIVKTEQQVCDTKEDLLQAFTSGAGSRSSNNRHKPHHNAQSLLPRLKYQDALALKHPFVQETVETRHLTLAWHQAGQVEDAVRKIVEAGVGQYRGS